MQTMGVEWIVNFCTRPIKFKFKFIDCNLYYYIISVLGDFKKITFYDVNYLSKKTVKFRSSLIFLFHDSNVLWNLKSLHLYVCKLWSLNAERIFFWCVTLLYDCHEISNRNQFAKNIHYDIYKSASSVIKFVTRN